MYEVLLTDNIAPQALEELERYGEIKAERIGTPSPEELLEMIGRYHALNVRSPTKVTAQVLARAKNLRFIGRAGVGVDNIDLEEATKRGVVVMNCPGGNTISTAEHTVGMILALARKIPAADRSLRSGAWDRARFKGRELFGRTLGLVGLGRVGKEVARRLLAFSMKVLAHDPYIEAREARALGVEMVSLEELLRRSDIVSVHVPLNDETRGLIGAREIASMRDGALLVNCARGGIVDEGAVAEALRSGKLAGVAFDVYQDEPPTDRALFAHETSVFTPHIAASTAEAQVRIAREIAQRVARALCEGVIECAVNPSGGGQG